MLSDLIQQGIENFLQNLVEQAINLFLTFMANMNGVASEVLDIPVVNSGILYSQLLAGSILVSKIAYEIWLTYILRTHGDPDADPGGLFLRIIQAIAVLGGIPWIVKYVYLFGTKVATDVAGLPGSSYTDSGQVSQMFDLVVNGGEYIVFIAVGIIFAAIVFLIIWVQFFIRAAELAMIAVTGAFMALGLSNASSQIYGTWWKELITVSFAQAIQIFLIKVSFFVLTDMTLSFNPMTKLMLFCGFLWVTYKSPSILKGWVHSTGIGKASQSVGSMVLMRRMMMRK